MPDVKYLASACKNTNAWRAVLFTTLPLVILWALIQRTFPLSRPPVEVGCANRPIKITDIYVIHSYWSKDRRDLAPGICRWLAEHGGPLADVPCTLAPGFWASAAPRSAILDLIKQRVVAPESHARPVGWYTKLLYRFHISGAAALFDEQEQPISLSYLGIAAVNVMAQSNWTAAMTRAGVPLRDRVNRHLLLIEDDADFNEERVAMLQRTVAQLDPCYDMVGLDYKESFCSLQRFKDGLASWFLPRSWRSSPHLVRAKLAFSRTTGLLFSYKGALRIQSAMPVTRELDLWYRDLITDGLLKVYVTCPRVVGIMGLPTVT
ncbi:hypothetical protein CHLRE_18g748547v5 [Chlamydomonas reinhardtii]|uniref:Uncharacterized protein n=1 Tax=Chlamydomonas reinhardtii TaxID=3055 RepID=A8J1R1_CHLRE|nr:uncharacterized protein CHLRE_18g748547v5 [Chlamydomonas reinhardtii]PNW69835.1 hypothetical protein CHLRE_18g748547v5 [Chlamydomonas reinhardtii]|eukprot:XP_001695151.1 predicted protein [Chlamydomonas reinhardtii]